jgi:hypothetical protein
MLNYLNLNNASLMILAIPEGNFLPRWLPSDRPGVRRCTMIYYMVEGLDGSRVERLGKSLR